MLKVAKVMQLKSLYKGTNFSYFLKINGGIIKVISLALITILILHFFACVFSALAVYDTDNYLQSWIFRYNGQNFADSEVYLTAYYFGMTTLTTVGYGDITAFTSCKSLFHPDEVVVVIIWMLIGVVFYSYTIGLITTFFSESDTKQTLLAKRLRNLDDFCTELKIDSKLSDGLAKALEYSATKLTYQWLEPHKKIFEGLPIRLKYEFLMAIYGEFIFECPFFGFDDIGFIVKIVPLLKPMFCKAGTILYRTGDFSSQSTLI